jgi:hypothetical protein
MARIINGIDVGINRINDENGKPKLVGDAAFDELDHVPGTGILKLSVFRYFLGTPWASLGTPW